ncbi:hypothetical protein LTS08_001548 [Lithohypha guttulata]|uniref:uncharacterized protein n=1 Tax=Lithohypha guttulata TaxID=1690604 RepID=UPI002DDED9CF|nr:hypothetical protein LTR51_003784 [Lithohypha guttulata]KAK5105273.1 hypothetical protein LTS08_001548 [Lithohypha guttulata]
MAEYATPPRPGPGGYTNTPAPQARLPAPSFTATPAPQRYTQAGAAISGTGPSQAALPSHRPQENVTAAQRTSRAVNEALRSVERTNSLEEEYGGRLAQNYDIRKTPVWAPFERFRHYVIPDQIFEQLNRANVATNMGLFAELHYAWVTVDNALYLWDYTQNNPELLGFEDQRYNIDSVQLAKPKPGVFLESINHMIVLASTDQIMLLGLGVDPSAPTTALSLFQTGLTASVKGLRVNNIVSSARTGRVFFSSETDNEVRELRYQAQDSWFASRCSIVNHTQGRFDTFTGALKSFTSGETEYVTQMDIDDSRNILYTLSSKSTIRAFYVSPDGYSLEKKAEITIQTIHRSIDYTLQNGHISDNTKLVSLNAIGKAETQAWVLMTTTVEGYRIYLSGTFSYTEPRILQALAANHTRTPPQLRPPPDDAVQIQPNERNAYLTQVISAYRFPPGYFFAAISRSHNASQEHLFVSVPDSQADVSFQRSQQGTPESSSWIELHSQVMAIGLQTPYRGATSMPKGFGYELAVQFDEPVPEIAILTNTGVHVLRRKRFVDSISTLIRQGGAQEGFQVEIQKLIQKYGRQEVLADALAVACGQSLETASERKLRINDPEVLEAARKIFIEYGGRPSIDQNLTSAVPAPIDAVRPSPRYEAAVRYLSRLIRSTWNQPIAKQERTVNGIQIVSAVKVEKLRAVQENLTSLQRFFDTNKSFIRGLSGPDDLTRQTSKDDEIALQGEHRALTSLVKFLSEMIEAISFVLVLFEEKVVEIIPLLSEDSRKHFMNLTYEHLVATEVGIDIARDLVRAIVNRNIAKGSNVETIAEALRRKCGNFCSADDAVIFKATELWKRAQESRANVEASRIALNESLKLFEKVAASLPYKELDQAVTVYKELEFHAGAIQLALRVASGKDKTNEAQAWVSDGKPENDPRREKFEMRTQFYSLVHTVLEAIDANIQNGPPFVDGRPSIAAIRRDEAYEVIAHSKDEIFLTNLFDWYLTKGWTERLLSTDTVSDFIVTYLQRRASEDVRYADLLWRYYGNNSQFHEAAKVQLNLAQSDFTDIKLDQRIEYLSRARANASAFTTNNNAASRKTKQKLLTEINTLIEVANIQDDILQRLSNDTRLTGDKRAEVMNELNGPMLSISDLFNRFADSAGYYDVCLYIYAIADHRDAAQIKNTWAQFLQATHVAALQYAQESQRGEAQRGQENVAVPLDQVVAEIRSVAHRLKSSEAVFPVPTLIEMLERYNTQHLQGNVEANVNELSMNHWVPDLFFETETSYELIYDSLETIYLATNQPTTSSTERRIILSDLLYVIDRWLQVSLTRAGQGPFGGEAGQERVEELLVFVTERFSAQELGQANYVLASDLRQRIIDLVA